MAKAKIPDYVSWLRQPDVNRGFLDMALRNYPLQEVRSALSVGLKRYALKVKDSQPESANYFWEKSQALEAGEEVKVFGRTVAASGDKKKSQPPGCKTIGDLSKRVKRLMAREDLRDPEFRALLAASQIGDISKYLTHDTGLNPSARPYGSPGDEVLAYGQAFVQLVGLAESREIDIEQAIRKGLENWEEGDWRKSIAKESGADVIKGMLACGGNVTGSAFLDPEREKLDKLDGEILITRFARPDIAAYFSKASGIVTDEGGTACHAAVIAREYNLPCIVGTGNATQRIPNGRKIRIEPGEKPGEGLVYLL